MGSTSTGSSLPSKLLLLLLICICGTVTAGGVGLDSLRATLGAGVGVVVLARLGVPPREGVLLGRPLGVVRRAGGSFRELLLSPASARPCGGTRHQLAIMCSSAYLDL